MTPAQIEGWKPITAAVHDAGGTIVMQLMHGGRVGHPAISGEPRVVAPSALAAPDRRARPRARQTSPSHTRSHLDEIPEVIEQFAQAARNAIAAGFDGVEGARCERLSRARVPVSGVEHP